MVCTILLAWRVYDDAPVVLAANRDELLTRPSDPPLLLQEDPPLWGGRDRLAGGTWLAVDATGRVAAVTNRHPGGRLPERDVTRRSRGGLPAAVLSPGGDAGARLALSGLEPVGYNPVNVLYLSAGAATWVGLDDERGRQAADLAPGVHVLTEQDPDDPDSAKATALLSLAAEAAGDASGPDALVARWRGLLASHERLASSPESAPCIHESLFGTVSSATVVVDRRGVRFDHAEGPPCVTGFEPVPMS